MSNCPERIANNQKRYLVTLAYVELGDQNGVQKETVCFALNPSHALAKTIIEFGSEQLDMPLAGYSVYHCERVLNSE